MCSGWTIGWYLPSAVPATGESGSCRIGAHICTGEAQSFQHATGMMSYARLSLQNAECLGSTAISTLAMVELPHRSRLCHLLVLCIICYLPQGIAVQPFTNIPVLASTTTSYCLPNAATAETLASPFPYHFPQLGQSAADLFPMPDCNGFVLEEATIDQLQDAMVKGQLTSLQIALCYLQRIQQTDEYVKYAFKSFLINVRSIV